MANALYGQGRASFLKGEINWASDAIKVSLINTAEYIVSIDADQYMNTNTIPLSARGGTPQTLGTKTTTLGVADAADITFSTVAGTVSYEALVIWKDGGDGGTSVSGTNDKLIAYIDTATGLPVTSNGGDITVTWDNGANKIFKL